jgi:hypothetical protein
MDREAQAKLLDVIAKCWTDDAYKQKLLADPRSVLAAEGITVPAGVNLKVIDQQPNDLHLFIPPRPAGDITVRNISSKTARSSILGSEPLTDVHGRPKTALLTDPHPLVRSALLTEGATQPLTDKCCHADTAPLTDKCCHADTAPLTRHAHGPTAPLTDKCCHADTAPHSKEGEKE